MSDNENRKVIWTGGIEHWTTKGDVKRFLWNKAPAAIVERIGTLGSGRQGHRHQDRSSGACIRIDRAACAPRARHR